MDVRFYLSLFLRRIHYFLLMLALGAAIGITLALVLPPLYRAQARLVVESAQIPGDLAASTVQVAAIEQLQIIQQRVLTRETLLEMANRLRIYQDTPGQAPARMTADEIVENLRERITFDIIGGNSREAQATFVTIGFEAPRAELSAAVANEIVTLVLKENVEMRKTVAGQTLDFFIQEVERLDRELSESSAEILAFKEANKDALPDSIEFRRNQQAAAQERLLQVERDEAALRDRREGLIKLYETTGQVGTAEPEPRTAEERQLKSLRDQLTSELAVLSPTHPKVRMLESQIAALEKVVTAQLAAASPDTAQLSPLEVQLADMDSQLAFLAQRKVQITTELAELRTSIEATPGNAATLETLERDQANIRAQYDQAVASKALAETGDTIEALARGQRITVLEQAVAPTEPASPNRPLIAAAGVGGGLAAGIGLILLLELLKGAIRRPEDLVARLGITPFATLPYLRTPGAVRRRRAVLVLGFAVVLLAIPLGLWWVHAHVRPLDLLFDRLLHQIGLAALSGGPAT